MEGTTVAVLIHNMGFYSLSACRIVYVIDESEEDVKQRYQAAHMFIKELKRFIPDSVLRMVPCLVILFLVRNDFW